ncbi:hypothetical protein Fuma_04920 [Fuerstiella marisgermanici]|uniref:Uncharacterized protein n=2 Tax=Fuerstiella marisgermanici TaxID=1891926 RepID=A0A1P8WMI6_9PLAN|nr:hypothetical protein Fuma_04920 [Fuerstiella marisgermanici]
MFAAMTLFAVVLGCQEEPTTGDKIRDVGDGIGDAVGEVGDEIGDVKDDIDTE